MGRNFRIIAACASLLVANGAIAAASIGIAAGRWPKLDIVNHLAPLWLIGGLAALLVALLSGKSRLRPVAVTFALLAVGLTGARVFPEYLARLKLGPGPARASERLKIIQFNAYVLNNTPQKAVDWLIGQRADIIVIEEGGGLTRPQLVRLRSAYPHCTGCLVKGSWSNLILSTRPAVAQGRFDIVGPSGVQGGWSRFEGPGGEFTVVGAHLAWPWLPVAARQHVTLADFVSHQPKNRLILAGDFNMTPWSHALRGLDRKLGLNRLTHGQSSWPASTYYKIPNLPVLPVPYVAIDQVYAGDGWRAVKVERGPRIGSDHYPIVVELIGR